MPVWTIILLSILVVLIAGLIILTVVGNKRKKKQEEQMEEMSKQAQTLNLFIIDMKKMHIKDAGLPKIVLESTPRMAKLSKVPILKVKAGNRVMSLICDAEVFKTLLPKQEIKAKVSGIYVLSAKYVRGPKYEAAKDPKSAKNKRTEKFLDKLR